MPGFIVNRPLQPGDRLQTREEMLMGMKVYPDKKDGPGTFEHAKAELAERIDDLHDQWAEAGGTAAHPAVKKELYAQAKQLGIKLPGMK